jgi:hypothetical protein
MERMVIVYEGRTSYAILLTTTLETNSYRYLLQKQKLKTCMLTGKFIQQSLVSGSRPRKHQFFDVHCSNGR